MIKVSFYVNEVTFGKHLRVGLVARGQGEGRRGGRLSSTGSVANDFVNRIYVMRPP